MSAKWEMHPSRRDGDLVHVVTEEDGTEVGLVWNAENATLASAAPDMLNLLTAADRLEVLTGENLAVYARTFAALARAAIAKATGGNTPAA